VQISVNKDFMIQKIIWNSVQTVLSSLISYLMASLFFILT